MRARSVWLPTLVCAASLMSVTATGGQGQSQGQGKPDHPRNPGQRKQKKNEPTKAKGHAAQPVDQRARFHGLDKNHDGVVSRAEWDGDAHSFANHDWNHDGVLSGAEIDSRAPRPGVSAQKPGGEPDEVLFARMDKNHDQRLSRSEWTGSGSDFERLDVNKDRWMSPYEFGVGR